MQTTTHAVGIDLGTTYSCIAYLNEHGEPVTLANQEGELATPSVVLFDGDEPIVGTEALRNAIVRPHDVVQNAKRYMGENKTWVLNGRRFTPVDISALVLKKLLSAAQEQIGEIKQAVVTVPAQFSDAQRHETMEAGHKAGLERVDIINEPVAAALCYVLGTEGLWFTELADEQRILVYDLGGGTFDLSLVRYEKNEVSVIKSSGDLQLGGIDWTQCLVKAIADQYTKEFKPELGAKSDPRLDPESLQFLTLEAEQTKRSLTVRPKAALTCQHGGRRKTYQVEQPQFEKLTKTLLDRTVKITEDMLRDEHGKVRWGSVNVVLTTGGSSRMPMIRNKLKEMSGTTLNTSLSPDQSIAHGATYYAGMLLTNSKFAKTIINPKAAERLASVKQRSVNARALGIMVRDRKTDTRHPHYLLKENTPLPADVTEHFGTIVANQRRVKLEIVESGTSAGKPPAVLGACVIDNLPPNLPRNSEIAVTISYDAQARVHVSARDVSSGKMATVEIIRQENVVQQLEAHGTPEDELVLIEDSAPPRPKEPKLKPVSSDNIQVAPRPNKPTVQPAPKQPGLKARSVPTPSVLENAQQPVPLCNRCGETLDARGKCPNCKTAPPGKSVRPAAPPARPAQAPPVADEDILDLAASPKKKEVKKTRPVNPRRNEGEEDFWS